MSAARDGDKAPSPPVVTLKRPPPSPSTSSSPKRAASEDPQGGDNQPHSHLTASALPSSPLGMDIDETESTGWVARTGQVSLDNDTAQPGHNGVSREQCMEVQGLVMCKWLCC